MDLAELNILLIEDNPADAELIQEMVEQCETPCFLRTAVRLEDGLRLLEQERFDAVFLDLGLPDSSGVETFRRLQERAPDLPLIVLTGMNDSALAAEAISLGAQDYLTKGKIDAEILYRSVLYSMERKRSLVAVRESKELSENLNRLDGVIHSTLELNTILGEAVEAAAQSLNAEAAAVGLFEREHYVIKAVYNLPRELLGSSVESREMSGISYAAAMRDVVLFDDAYQDDRLNQDLIRMLGIRSMMIAPLVVKSAVVGAASFYRFSAGLHFTEGQRDFARKLAFSLSAAIDNSRLYEALRTSEQVSRNRLFQLQAIYASAPVGLSFIDTGLRYVSINRRMAELNQLPPEGHLGKTIREVLRKELADSTEAFYRRVLETGVPAENIELQGLAAGQERYWLCSYYPVRDQSDRIIGVNAMAQEITGRKKMEEEIRHLANHDALTGLPNRRLFLELISLEKAQSRRHGTSMAVFFLDLDRFKIINDTLGHEAGDELLKQVATGLRRTVRSSDTVARIGGDEFNIIVPDISRAEDAGDVARKIVEYFSRSSFFIAGQEFSVTASIGISLFPHDSEEIDALLRYADIAMYHAKERGRNHFQFYNPEINVRSLERMHLETWLGQSLERGELFLHYQPQIDITSRRIICGEALVRWRHPERGVIDPDHFIPLAEETGFISAIDEWVLWSVCRQLKKWLDGGMAVRCITVNISARLFGNPGLIPTVTRILQETGLPAGRLDLEITETMAMSNVELTAVRLKELSGMGIHISIDDFGTGYSSLSYLKRLPIERLKIDRSFIQDITTSADDRTIISAVTAMAHNMKMKVIAEGVETEEQLAFLRETGCDEMQGFLFSRPVPADEFEALFAGTGS